jgi:2-methylcitrate synthase
MSEIQKGLAGVVADATGVSKVMPETNSLTYRGYAVQDLAEHCRFEEVAYLILNGELPNAAQLKEFNAAESSQRAISEDAIAVLRRFPPRAHPMDTLRTGVSFLGLEDPETADNGEAANMRKSIRLLAKIPTLVANDFRIRKGMEPIAPRADLGFAENFFHMYFGQVPEPEVVKAFDISLTLYAEHSFNASTFTARVVASTLADIYSATVAGIGALKGPLHGGANEAVMHMMLEIADPAKARDWMLDALATKKKVMGFGHRVYRSGDSRVPTMKKAFEKMARVRGGEKWLKMYDDLEAVMIEKKNIYPNLDFPTGPAYYLMGFEIPIFTPIFVMSRTTGWSAHVMEQLRDNKLIRPLSAYSGPEQRAVPTIDKR